MTNVDDKLSEAEKYVRNQSDLVPKVGLVLGSGLGAYADELDELVKIPYGDIPHMPEVMVSGHAGNLCLGKVEGVPVACLAGRVHCYEGYTTDEVVFGARLLARLGCEAVLLTNAAGGLVEMLAPGDLMLITDHINLMGRNPLVGPNDPEVGPRFPDMSYAYDQQINAAARRAARETEVALVDGVYVAVLGPSYETPAEVRMLQTLGAQAVGMSTVPEVLALRHRGVRVGAMSLVTNAAAGLSRKLLDHSEVEQTAREARARFSRLLGRWVGLVFEELGRRSTAPGQA